MVDSCDPATGKLVTIEGNVHEGIRPDAAGEAQRTPGRRPPLDDDERPELDRGARPRHGRPARRPRPVAAVRAGDYQERGARTVFGIGRPSLVDFEHHDFGLQAIPDDLKYVSPEEMRVRGQRARLAAGEHGRVAAGRAVSPARRRLAPRVAGVRPSGANSTGMANRRAARRVPRHLRTGFRRSGLGGDRRRCDRHSRRGVRLRALAARDGIRDRPDLGLPHQPGRHRRAGALEADAIWTRRSGTGSRRCSARSSRRCCCSS